MANEVRIRTSVKDDASKPLKDLHDAWKRFQADGAKGLAIGAGAFASAKAFDLVGTAISGVLDYASTAISKASDLNETIQKSQVVFGSASKGIEDWGKTAATSMGLSENAAIGAAASIGNLLLSTGTAPDKIAPMSEAMVKLASDLASFNNISVDDALAKIQSGLVGQERPLRELGVAISAASVDTEAYALGFQKLNGQFSEGEKVQARYSLILKQTKTAQGDFARTSDQLANSLRQENAMLDDAQANLGTKLLPIQLKVTRFMVNEVIPALDTLINNLGTLGDAWANLTDPIHFAQREQEKAVMAAIAARDALVNGAVDVAVAYSKTEKGKADDVRESSHLIQQSLHDEAFASSNTAKVFGDDGQKIGGYVQLIGTKALSAEGQLSAAMTGMVSDLRTAKTDLATAATAAANATYDPQIAALQMFENKKAIIELEAKLKSGKLDHAQTVAAEIELANRKKDHIGLLTTLAEAGNTNARKELLHIAQVNVASKTASKDQKAYWQGVIDKLTALDAAQRGLLTSLKNLDYMANHVKDDLASLPASVGKQVGHRAAGGPVSAGQAYVVGEKRAELFVPSTSGTILPSVPMSGGGGFSGAYPVPVPMGWTPSQQQAWAREATPIIARELQRQGLIAR